MTPEFLAGMAGVILSLICSYVPGIAPKYNALAPDYKRLVMLGLLALAAAAIFGASCAGVDVGATVTCDQAGVVLLLRVLLAALVANQAADRLSPKVGAKASSPWIYDPEAAQL